MAQKGKRTNQKSRSAPKTQHVERKTKHWTIAFQGGTHSKKSSIPLGIVLRDLLNVCKNLKEVRNALQNRMVFVDGIARTNYRFPIGLFDTISFHNSRYRTLIDHLGRIKLVEEKEKKEHKLCKVTGKTIGKKGMIVLSTHDGRTFLEKKTGVNVGDSIMTSIPEQKITGHFSLEKGNTALVVSGKHVGALTKIMEVIPSTMKRKKAVTLESKGQRFQTTAESVFVVGKEKSEIALHEAMA